MRYIHFIFPREQKRTNSEILKPNSQREFWNKRVKQCPLEATLHITRWDSDIVVNIPFSLLCLLGGYPLRELFRSLVGDCQTVYWLPFALITGHFGFGHILGINLMVFTAFPLIICLQTVGVFPPIEVLKGRLTIFLFETHCAGLNSR